MSVLVTGGGGFVGLHLLRRLHEEGVEDVWATVVGDAPSTETLPAALRSVRWLSMDVRSAESIVDVVDRVRPKSVYHLAGQASVGESFDAPLATWEVNATGTLRLLTILGRESPGTERVLLASSAEVYGAVPADEQPIEETRPFRPVTPYGVSKVAAEVAAVQAGSAHGIEVVVARSFNHIGPGQDERFALPSMARQLVRMRSGRDEAVLRVGNLAVERDFLDVRDVARAYVSLMDRGPSGQALNVCSGHGHSLLDLVTRLIELSETGARLEVDPDRVRPADIPALVGDPRRMNALGWDPRVPIDDSLRDLLQEAEAR